MEGITAAPLTLTLKLSDDSKSYEQLVDPIVRIGTDLKSNKYTFRTITPNSHARIVDRYKVGVVDKRSKDELREFFGWNLTSPIDDVPALKAISSLMRESKLLADKQGGVKSAIRFSTFDERTSTPSFPLIFAHSSFPTVESDAIFFGPDTYRFFNFIRKATQLHFKPDTDKLLRVVDIGAGSGAGGLFLAKELLHNSLPRLEVILTDINSKALFFCKANAILNFSSHKSPPQFSLIESNLYESLEGNLDFIISNPPYMVDNAPDSKAVQSHNGASRMYRDGGGVRGIDLSVRIVNEGIKKLNHGGLLALYTGVPIIAGEDPFFNEISSMLTEGVQLVEYEEIDVDVWGEELEGGSYADVDRIAVVGLIIRKV